MRIVPGIFDFAVENPKAQFLCPRRQCYFEFRLQFTVALKKLMTPQWGRSQ